MMEEIFLNIRDRLTKGISTLALVDEDCGQLEYGDQHNPLIYPAALISAPTIDWQNVDTGGKIQKGIGSINIRLAVDCYDDNSSLSVGSPDAMRQRIALNQQVYALLQGMRPCAEAMPMTRVKCVQYNVEGGIKVYDTSFRFTMMEKQRGF